MRPSPQERGSSCKPPACLPSRATAVTVIRATCPTSPHVKSLRFSFAAFLFFFANFASASVARSPVSVAAASNFVYALDDLAAAFQRTASDVELSLVTGASGNLVAQIRHGARCDVFLSADREYPEALIASGHAERSSFTVFAIGRLVLWTTRTSLPFESVPDVVRDSTVRKLAIAHPDTAPYGRAALQVLEAFDLKRSATPKIVIGENITQTAQFVETGHADAGFVALSLVQSPRLKNRGRWLEIPPGLHLPLEHAAVLTTRGATNSAARRFLAFLHSEPAREILQRHGYALPP